MKKGFLVLLLVVFLCSGCTVIYGNKTNKDRTVDFLLNRYVEGYMEADEDVMKDILPDFYYKAHAVEYSKEYMTSDINRNKSKYGDDFTIKFDIETDNKLSNDKLKRINDNITSDSRFNTDKTASECHQVKGKSTISGSINSYTSNFEAYYCMYDGIWYIAFE